MIRSRQQGSRQNQIFRDRGPGGGFQPLFSRRSCFPNSLFSLDEHDAQVGSSSVTRLLYERLLDMLGGPTGNPGPLSPSVVARRSYHHHHNKASQSSESPFFSMLRHQQRLIEPGLDDLNLRSNVFSSSMAGFWSLPRLSHHCLRPMNPTSDHMSIVQVRRRPR